MAGIYVVDVPATHNGRIRFVVIADNAGEAEAIAAKVEHTADPASFEVGRLGTYDPGIGGAGMVGFTRIVAIHRPAFGEAIPMVKHLPATPGQQPDGSIQQDEPSSVGSGQARVWTARYALTARDDEEARKHITAKALADVPDATVEFLRGPTRDRGPRSYWRATVRRTRD